MELSHQNMSSVNITGWIFLLGQTRKCICPVTEVSCPAEVDISLKMKENNLGQPFQNLQFLSPDYKFIFMPIIIIGVIVL